MSQWAGGVLTAAGRALQAKVEAGTTALVLTKIKLGDGTESMDAVDNLTDLVGSKAVLGISSSVADGDHATITGVVLSTQLQAGFWCREWGLFATDPDDGEILYMITIDNQPEWIPASTAAAQVSATYAMNIAVANATNIEVQIDPAGLVDVEMLDSYMGLAKRSTPVAVEETAMLENLPAMYFLECTTAGVTGATAPVITPPVTEGDTISDGSVEWTVRKSIATGGGALGGGDITYNLGDPNGVLRFTSDDNGGSINIFGSDTSGNGGVYLGANGNDSDTLSALLKLNKDGLLLDLFTDGTLSQSIDIGSSGLVTNAGWYRKSKSGVIVQCGWCSAATSRSITFPITFGVAYIIMARYDDGQAQTPAGAFTITNIKLTGCTINQSLNYSGCNWCAVGM